MLAIDAPHASLDAARTIREISEASCLSTVWDGVPGTGAALASVDWEKSANGAFEERIDKEHGRGEELPAWSRSRRPVEANHHVRNRISA